MEFEYANDRRRLDPVIAAFEKFCVGAVNVTYKRYAGLPWVWGFPWVWVWGQ